VSASQVGCKRSDDDAHEWVSFEHQGDTWLFDVTFLASNWTCIWDQGCLGIRDQPTPEAAQGCCSFGAHFTDDADRARVVEMAAALTPAQWQHFGHHDDVVVQDADGAWSTSVVDDACVFLNRPGFPGGYGCALHRGAVEAEESIVAWKPDVCWQLPLRLEHHEDENGHAVATLREWRRHDWGEGGDEFHWWCTEDRLAFVEHTPVYERLREEIVALVGEPLMAQLLAYLDARPQETVLPHPSLRRDSR